MSIYELARREADITLRICRLRLPQFRQLERAIKYRMQMDPLIDVFEAYEREYAEWHASHSLWARAEATWRRVSRLVH